MTACRRHDTLDWVEAEVTFTNHTSKRSNYFAELTVVNAAGVKVADASASTNNLDPGQKALETAQTFQEVEGTFTCKIAEVTRYAS